MKKYLALKENNRNVNFLKVETYYSLGGMNYFYSKNESRGYYLSATPVERGTSSSGLSYESYIGFSGIKKLVKEVSRKSEKAAREADEKAKEYERDLINYILNENGLQLAE